MKKTKRIRYWLAIHTPIKLLNKNESKRLKIARFRAIALTFSMNTYNLSNDELLERMAESSRQMAKFGVSLDDLGKSIRGLNQAILK